MSVLFQKEFIPRVYRRISQILKLKITHQASSSDAIAFLPPIFVLGLLPRSGTNFLHRLLITHPDCVSCHAYESYVLERIDRLQTYVQETHQKWCQQRPIMPELFHACLGKGITNYLYQMTQCYQSIDVARQRLVIKTPSVENLESFFQFFPDSQILLVVREGRAVVESHARSFDSDRVQIMHDWAAAAGKIAKFTQQESAHSQQVLVVRYEDLHMQTAKEVGRVLDFLNLNKSDYDFESALNLPVFGSSTFGKAKDEKFTWKIRPKAPDFDPLNRAANWTSEANEKFEEIAGEHMRYFNY